MVPMKRVTSWCEGPVFQRPGARSTEGIGGRKPEADARCDDERAVRHARDQEELGLQHVDHLGLARGALQELLADQSDAQARAERCDADQQGDCEGKDVEAGHGVFSWWLVDRWTYFPATG